MLVIGVAGPAGSGKSTVCRMLAHRSGVAYINCDELAWATYRHGGPSYAPLVARFGEEILTEDGAVDRDRLGRVALGDPQAKADLEAIVHPAVMEELHRAAAEHSKRGTEVVLVEGALLLASPYVDRTLFDAFVWLYAPEEERHKRLLSSGLEGSTVRRRLEAQGDLAPPVDPSVYPVDASGRPVQAADRMWDLIQTLKQSGSQGAEHL
ncbi:MAG: dephospho-CoA kinase [Candidatus Bipolaricaulota bacterium]